MFSFTRTPYIDTRCFIEKGFSYASARMPFSASMKQPAAFHSCGRKAFSSRCGVPNLGATFAGNLISYKGKNGFDYSYRRSMAARGKQKLNLQQWTCGSSVNSSHRNASFRSAIVWHLLTTRFGLDDSVIRDVLLSISTLHKWAMLQILTLNHNSLTHPKLQKLKKTHCTNHNTIRYSSQLLQFELRFKDNVYVFRRCISSVQKNLL